MIHKFTLQDDGDIRWIPIPTQDVKEASRQLKSNLLMFDTADLKRLGKRIETLLAEDEARDALAVMDAMPTTQALWWFIENVPADSAAHSECFFALRSRLAKEPG